MNAGIVAAAETSRCAALGYSTTEISLHYHATRETDSLEICRHHTYTQGLFEHTYMKNICKVQKKKQKVTMLRHDDIGLRSKTCMNYRQDSARVGGDATSLGLYAYYALAYRCIIHVCSVVRMLLQLRLPEFN